LTGGSPLQISDHLSVQAGGLERLQADIEVPGGGDVAVTENATNELIVAWIGFEHDVGRGMTKSMRRDL